MSDVKKVIDGLEHEIARANIADLEWLDCVEVELLHDALALLKAQGRDIADMRNDLQDTLAENLRLSDFLKAQEPVEPKIIDTANSKLYHNDIFKNYYCGNCGEFLHVVNRKDLFCSQCGRQVKWDG